MDRSRTNRASTPNDPHGSADASQHSQTTVTTTAAAFQPQLYQCCGGIMCPTPRSLWHQTSDRYLLPFSHVVLSSLVWRTSLVVGNFLLLFGNPIHMLWLPPQADTAMDVLYTLVLVIFIADMGFRAVAMPGYFGISVRQIYHPSSKLQSSPAGGGSSTSASSSASCWSWFRCINMGSFLFYCDLLSTLTLLYEISYINPDKYKLLHYEIHLDRVGIPVRIEAKNNLMATTTIFFNLLTLLTSPTHSLSIITLLLSTRHLVWM
jgi:hypothetical protein